ncbi:MAG: hypothetical protein ACKPKO_01015, partial [Candidatus Fonsibacter sp.]
ENPKCEFEVTGRTKQTKQENKRPQSGKPQLCGCLTGPPLSLPKGEGFPRSFKKQPQKKHYTPTGNLELVGPLKDSLINHELENSFTLVHEL